MTGTQRRLASAFSSLSRVSKKFVCRSRSNRTGHGTTDWFQIGKGVCHQDCMLSPCLFNLYAEYIMRNAGLNEASPAWASGLRAPLRDCRGPPYPVGCFPVTSLMGKASASVGPFMPGLRIPRRRATVPGQGVASLPAAWV